MANNNRLDDSVAEELRQVKLLLIAQLLRDGVKQGAIGSLLGLSAASMSRLLAGAGKAIAPRD